jgi:hypothetical protein
MIKERAWPVRAMYILIAVALAMSLFITTAPAHKVSASSSDVVSQWGKVPTPSEKDWVLRPPSTIIDYALASNGTVTYAAVEGWNERTGSWGYWVLKSINGAATWTDLNVALEKVDDANTISEVYRAQTDEVDADFLAVALEENKEIRVYFSTDGGTTFNDAGRVIDNSDGNRLTLVSDIEVSPEVAGKRDMAIFGEADTSSGAGIFRCTVTGDTASVWKDATQFNGWDDGTANPSWIVVEGKFSPNYATDRTILLVTVAASSTYDSVYLQSGSWPATPGTPGWNDKSTLGINAVSIIDNVPIPYLYQSYDGFSGDARAMAGLTLPKNYNSKSTNDTRVLWVWVNYWDPAASYAVKNAIVRVDNDDADASVVKQVKDGKLWLTNISYLGTIDEGQALAGVLGDGGFPYNGNPAYLLTDCGKGVQVYRNTGIHNMEICCEPWKSACKPPTGRAAMAVSLVSEDKAYAVALQGFTDYDEGAWSVTFDGGDAWNQLSLIDTEIDYLSDVEVSPDCNKMFLVSVYEDSWNNNVYIENPNSYFSPDECGILYPRGDNYYDVQYLHCDSVWQKATNLPEAQEYSGRWLRTWCGFLEGTYWGETAPEAGFLRLPDGETTGDTVYLVDYGTSNVYENDLETLGCWTSISSTTLDDIVDLVATGGAVNTTIALYALGYGAQVSIYDSEGWHEAVDSKVYNGYTIAVHGQDILVGGMYDGEVAYSSDGGTTFDLLQDETGTEVDTPITGHVTVAFDTYFDTNNVIYAAVEGWSSGWEGGIYRWVIGTSTAWKDLGADHHYGYTGLLLSNINGNPYTSAATGGVLYASYVGYTCDSNWSSSDDYFNCWKDTVNCWDTGVARCLTPAADISCEKCIEWDYLTVGITPVVDEQGYIDVGFQATPKALKMCGCLTPDTNSKLFAIDSWSYRYNEGYDMDLGQQGTVWTFEDCYAKKAPELLSPASNTTIPGDCYCNNLPFSLKWDGVCDACYYDVQIALDPEFTDVVVSYDYQEGGKDILGATGLSKVVPGVLTCQVTYYWRVRAHEASTCQIIHSWWSDMGTITVAPGAAQGAIDLIAPVSGATDVGIKSVGFSWHLQATANKFDWVLSANADLSSPVESKTGLTNTAYTCTKALVHGTTYYWQVKAYEGSTLVSTSAVGTFTTGAQGAYCDPTTGLCFDTQKELTDYEATHAAPATPMWVWVVIAIGAVLVIVVIVLIFRTRRV